MNKIKFLIVLCVFFLSLNLQAKTYKVSDQESYFRTVPLLKPGDTLVLANGVWNDFRIVFKGNGTPEALVTLCAETPGKVIIAGKSNLKLAGSYLAVKGLVFKNGSTPDDAVISFKVSDQEFAVNSRVTDCVVDGFNKPIRYDEDNYVALWGRNNRIDHCYLAGKTTIGVTLEVNLFNKDQQGNQHHIDHNYFGHRPRLGSNGGETIRVGSSNVSKQPSFTYIESNYFERCNGETEVVSIKSCDNTIRFNTFFECEGGLVLRHGDRNTVSGNFFIGNGKAETAGIRVINDGHKIYNNYLSGLKGKDFRAPLVLMDGVPNSPLIRYHQVNHVEIVGNVWVNCDMPWHFGYPFLFRGNETERVSPINTVLAWNIVYNKEQTPLISVYDNIDGITFKNNYTNLLPDSISRQKLITTAIALEQKGDVAIPSAKDMDISAMTKAYSYTVVNTPDNHLPLSALAEKKATRNNCGPDWYNYHEQKKYVAHVLSIKPGKNTLTDALKRSAHGDTIVFAGEGVYSVDQEVRLNHHITLKAGPGLRNKPVIQAEKSFQGKTLIRIAQGGAVNLEGLSLISTAGDNVLHAIASERDNMSQAYTFFANHCLFDGFKNAVIKGYKGTFADTVLMENCILRNSVSGLSFNEETEDKGIYNAEVVILRNTVFHQLQKNAIDLYRGGTDESTFGPFLEIDHCVFNAIGTDKNDLMLKLTGVQHVTIANSIFSNAPEIAITAILNGKYNTIRHCILYQAGKFEITNGAHADTQTIYTVKPDFTKDGSFLLKKNSPLLKMGEEHTTVGIIQ